MRVLEPVAAHAVQSFETARFHHAARRSDNVVDRLNEAIKLYITKLTRDALDEREGRRAKEANPRRVTPAEPAGAGSLAN